MRSIIMAGAFATIQPTESPYVDQSILGDKELVKFDIRQLPEADPCDIQKEDEIVVCASIDRPRNLRITPIPNANVYGKDESAAEFSVGKNATAQAVVESAQLQPGVTSNRALIRLKIGF